ncbi:hypothetical protein BV898_19411 [Hypsibius exemplaris]|uniref:Uncharacterized protein n=1 Tax=Hypsibius exemplaris TaxID=2072580 RepID=A0A9X6RPQ9_HYPEX|nr:hypothetical protein BV898_19411 [Hypsibius exemplaris]
MWELKLTTRRELNINSSGHGVFVRYVDTRDFAPGWKMGDLSLRDEDLAVTVSGVGWWSFGLIGGIYTNSDNARIGHILNVRG